MGLLQKTVRVSLAISLFVTQVALGAPAEANLWAERRGGTRSPAESTTLLASLPTLPLPPITALHPAAGHPPGDRSASPGLAAVPLSHARIREIQLFNEPAQPVLIVEDIHLNAEAQENIGVVLQSLIDGKAVDVVGVEGAVGELPLKGLRALRKKTGGSTALRSIAKDFVENGLMAAPSAVGLTSDVEPPPFVGFDDPAAYRENVRAYLESRRVLPQAERWLARSRASVEARKSAAFTRDLLAFDAIRLRYRSEEIELGDYLDRLATYGIDGGEQISRFREARAIESSLDFPRIERERTDFLAEIVRRLSPDETRQLLARSIAYRTGRIGLADFFRNLSDLGASKELSPSRYPQFGRYVRYADLVEKISADRLIRDVSILEGRIFASLASTAEQRRVGDLSDALSLVERMLRFSLTADEWYQYSQKAILMRREYAPGMVLSSFEKFYRCADERSQTMVEGILSRSGRRVLVTGGFHTREVAALLRDKKIPYAVVTPKITRVDLAGAAGYLSVFERESAPIDRLFRGERLFVNPSSVSLADRGLLLRTFASAWAMMTGQRSLAFSWAGRTYRLVTNLGSRPSRNTHRLVIDPITELRFFLLIPAASLAAFMPLGVVLGIPVPMLAAWVLSAIIFGRAHPTRRLQRTAVGLALGAWFLVPGISFIDASLLLIVTHAFFNLLVMALRSVGVRSVAYASQGDRDLEEAIAVARASLTPMLMARPDAANDVERTLEELIDFLTREGLSPRTVLFYLIPAIAAVSGRDPSTFMTRVADFELIIQKKRFQPLHVFAIARALNDITPLILRNGSTWDQAMAELAGWTPAWEAPIAQMQSEALMIAWNVLTPAERLARARRFARIPDEVSPSPVRTFLLGNGVSVPNAAHVSSSGDLFAVGREAQLVLVPVGSGSHAVVFSRGHLTCWGVSILAADASGREYVGHAHIFIPSRAFDSDDSKRQIDMMLAKLAEAGMVKAQMSVAIKPYTPALDRWGGDVLYPEQYIAANAQGFDVSFVPAPVSDHPEAFLDVLVSEEGITFGNYRTNTEGTFEDRSWNREKLYASESREAERRAEGSDGKPFSLRQNLAAFLIASFASIATLVATADPISFLSIASYAFVVVLGVHLATGAWVRGNVGTSEDPRLVEMSLLYFGPDVSVRFVDGAAMSRPDFLEETYREGREVLLHSGWVEKSSNPFLNLLRLLILPIVLAHAGGRLTGLPAPLIYVLKPIQALYAPVKILVKFALNSRGAQRIMEASVFDDIDEDFPEDESPTVEVEVAPVAQASVSDSHKPLIEAEPSPELDVVVIVPTYNEFGNGNIFRLIDSFTRQTEDSNRFEVILIVNNTVEAFEATSDGFRDNERTVELIRYVGSPAGTPAPGWLALQSSENRMVVSRAREKGLRIHAVDKTRGVPRVIGDIRNIGVFEAIERLERNGRLDSFIASLDADTLVPSDYISRLRWYKSQAVVDAVFTDLDFSFRGGDEKTFRVLYSAWLRRVYAQLDGSLTRPRPMAAGGPQIVARASVFKEFNGFPSIATGEDGAMSQKIGFIKPTVFADDITVQSQFRSNPEGYDSKKSYDSLVKLDVDSDALRERTKTVASSSIRFRLLRWELHDYVRNKRSVALTDEIRERLAFYGYPVNDAVWRSSFRGMNTNDELEKYLEKMGERIEMTPYESVRDFADKVLAKRAKGAFSRLVELTNREIKRDAVTLSRFQAAVRRIIAEVRQNPDIAIPSLVDTSDPDVLRVISAEAWFAKRVRDAVRLSSNDEDAYSLLVDIFPDWLRPFKETPVRRDLVTLRAFEGFISEARNRPSLNPEMRKIIERVVTPLDEIVTLDGYAPEGGVLEWLRAWLFPRMSPATYQRWAFVIENSFFTLLVGVPLVFLAFAISGDALLSLRIANFLMWGVFTAAHLPWINPGPRRNVTYASFISSGTILLSFLPTTAPIMVVVLMAGGLLIHFVTNLVARFRQSKIDPTTVTQSEAIAGAREFRRQLEAAPAGVAETLASTRVAAVFMGVLPEAAIPDVANVREVSDYLKSINSPVMAFRARRGPDGHFLNVPVAARVIANNPSFFPAEAVANPENWLRTQFQTWLVIETNPDVGDRAYGLLSGFPASAVLDWSRRRAVIRKMRETVQQYAASLDVRGREELLAFLSSVHFNVPNPGLVGLLRGINVITQEDAELLLAPRALPGSILARFVAFSDEQVEWAVRQREIYDQAIRATGGDRDLDQEGASTAVMDGEVMPDSAQDLAIHLTVLLREGKTEDFLAEISRATSAFDASPAVSWREVGPALAREIREAMGPRPTPEQRRRLVDLILVLSLALTKEEVVDFVANLDDLIRTRVGDNEALLYLVDSRDPDAAVAEARALVTRLMTDDGALRDDNRVAFLVPATNAAVLAALRADPVLGRLMAGRQVQIVPKDEDTTLTKILRITEAVPGWEQPSTLRVILHEGSELPPEFFDLPASDPRQVILNVILKSLGGIVEMRGRLQADWEALRATLIAA